MFLNFVYFIEVNEENKGYKFYELINLRFSLYH